jgi:hypothetical protein
VARSHVIRDPRTERLVGFALLVAGSYLLYDAYEGRGASRPFLTKLLPGP